MPPDPDTVSSGGVLKRLHNPSDAEQQGYGAPEPSSASADANLTENYRGGTVSLSTNSNVGGNSCLRHSVGYTTCPQINKDRCVIPATVWRCRMGVFNSYDINAVTLGVIRCL